MQKLTTLAIAAALGLAWTALPAIAADDTLKNKAERTGDKIENKTEKAKDKAEAKGDTMGDKMDRAVDKTKAKAREAKEKVSDKMHRGDKAEKMDPAETRNAQQALQAKGFNPGPIDGVYGPRTEAAVRDFQKAEGLKATGKMDADTRAKLMVSSGAGSAPAASTRTTTPSASPSTGATPASPSSVGAPSQAPAPSEKVEKK